MTEVDTFTFHALGKLAKTNPELCERIPFEVVWDDDLPDGGIPFYKDLVGDVSGCCFRSRLFCYRPRLQTASSGV
jgi:hypothetical protein